jgi:hypothetical protein
MKWDENAGYAHLVRVLEYLSWPTTVWLAYQRSRYRGHHGASMSELWRAEDIVGLTMAATRDQELNHLFS